MACAYESMQLAHGHGVTVPGLRAPTGPFAWDLNRIVAFRVNYHAHILGNWREVEDEFHVVGFRLNRRDALPYNLRSTVSMVSWRSTSVPGRS